MRKAILFACVFLSLTLHAQTGVKILFDARKAQMAGNADWVVDADLYNIGTGTGGVMQTGKGNEANPQRIPTPAQSGITSTTAETYWKGALSAWGVELAKRGYTVETLPFNVAITYGNTSNVQDLSNYKVFICVEPNIRFTSAEKTAILQFIQNGGGLFMAGNHSGSDRNNDSWDAPAIWNDLMSSNGIKVNPFGITFDLVSFSQTTSNFATIAVNPILQGAAGTPLQMKYSSGTSMTLNKTANATVTGLVYKTGAATTGTSNVMFAQARYGTGKVAAIGDSSPPDDGTGDTNDQLYNGWSAEVNGDHSRILLNATLWLANPALREGDTENPQVNAWPNPFRDEINVSFTSNGSPTELALFDMTGKALFVQRLNAAQGENLHTISVDELPGGLYLLRLNDGTQVTTKKLVRQ
ncbi:MAG: T9SS type A sorting domain-containing protein [Bacteroidota bacterium]